MGFFKRMEQPSVESVPDPLEKVKLPEELSQINPEKIRQVTEESQELRGVLGKFSEKTKKSMAGFLVGGSFMLAAGNFETVQANEWQFLLQRWADSFVGETLRGASDRMRNQEMMKMERERMKNMMIMDAVRQKNMMEMQRVQEERQMEMQKTQEDRRENSTIKMEYARRQFGNQDSVNRVYTTVFESFNQELREAGTDEAKMKAAEKKLHLQLKNLQLLREQVQ